MSRIDAARRRRREVAKGLSPVMCQYRSPTRPRFRCNKLGAIEIEQDGYIILVCKRHYESLVSK